MQCQGQWGECQAQLKAFSSLFSLVLPQSLAKGLAYNPQVPYCTGNKISFPCRAPGLPNWPHLGPTAFPKLMPFWPHQWALLPSNRLLILASGPLPVLFLEVFAGLTLHVSAEKSLQKPPAAPDLHYFLHRLCQSGNYQVHLLIYLSPSP